MQLLAQVANVLTWLADTTDLGTTLAPFSLAKGSSISGRREWAMATSMFFLTRTRASAVPILPEPKMEHFTRISYVSMR